MRKFITITPEMVNSAIRKTEKREAHINHHFRVKYKDGITNNDTDIIGFLGGFVACELLKIHWKNNIRADYITIDNGDGECEKGIFDVKTETLPSEELLDKVVSRSIDDKKPYGRRLINANQQELLKKYDIVIFGTFLRGDNNKWYPIGWIKTKKILREYSITEETPYGRTYPTQVLPIKTSDLKDIELLINSLE